MSEHTPGPWHIESVSYPERAHPEVYAGKKRVARPCNSADIPAPESDANAHLIAAAPELLEALEMAMQLKGGWREAITELEDFCSEPVRLKNMLAAADQLDDFARIARAAVAKARGA